MFPGFNDRRGASLAEQLVGMACLSILLVLVTGMLARGITLHRTTERTVVAAETAERLLRRLARDLEETCTAVQVAQAGRTLTGYLTFDVDDPAQVPFHPETGRPVWRGVWLYLHEGEVVKCLLDTSHPDLPTTAQVELTPAWMQGKFDEVAAQGAVVAAGVTAFSLVETDENVTVQVSARVEDVTAHRDLVLVPRNRRQP